MILDPVGLGLFIAFGFVCVLLGMELGKRQAYKAQAREEIIELTNPIEEEEIIDLVDLVEEEEIIELTELVEEDDFVFSLEDEAEFSKLLDEMSKPAPVEEPELIEIIDLTEIVVESEPLKMEKPAPKVVPSLRKWGEERKPHPKTAKRSRPWGSVLNDSLILFTGGQSYAYA